MNAICFPKYKVVLLNKTQNCFSAFPTENTGLFLTFNVSADVLVPNGMSTDNSQLADDDAHNFIRLRPTTVQSVTLRCLRAVSSAVCMQSFSGISTQTLHIHHF